MTIGRLLLAAASLSSVLQGANSCPVTLSNVKRDSGLGDNSTYCFSLNVLNNTSEAASEVVLHAAAYTSDHQRHTLQYDYPVANLRPGERRNVYFSTHRLLGTDYTGLKVWVSKVAQESAGSWLDDGAHSCGSQDMKE